MITLKPLHPDDFEALYPIVVAEEPFAAGFNLEQLKMELAKRDGWTLWDGGKVIGGITLAGLAPRHNVVIHAVVDPEYHGKWASRRLAKEVFKYIFIDLGLRRVSSYAIPFKTTAAAMMLTDLGFVIEGVTRCGGMTPDGEFYDVVNYGMLAEECRWLIRRR